MGFLSNVFAEGNKSPRSIADVEAALAGLSAEKNAARQAVADAMGARDELLLVDGTDGKIAELDAAADLHRLTLERCDKAEPLLLEELEGLRAEDKRARWRDLRARYDAAGFAYAKSLRAALDKMAFMIALNDEARGAGFEHEIQAAFIPPTRVLSPDTLAQFESAIERAREMARPAPTLRPRPPIAPPATPAIAAPAKPAVAAKPKARAVVKPPKPFTPPPPDADGRVAVVIVRSGPEIEGARPRAGETIRVPADQAAALVRNAAADYAGRCNERP